MAGRERADLVAIHRWLREPNRLHMRMVEAASRVRHLESVPGQGDALRSAREYADRLADEYARAWLERAMVIDAIPHGGEVAVLGLRYLQGKTIAQCMGMLDVAYSTVQALDLRGCQAILRTVGIPGQQKTKGPWPASKPARPPGPATAWSPSSPSGRSGISAS